jgi:hypothetical protein
VARQVGRCKLTENTHRIIVDSIAKGNYYSPAARAAGITYGTFRVWMKRGEAELARVGVNNWRRVKQKEKKYVDFYRDVKAAEAKSETALVENWSKLAIKDWRASAEMLARKHPERWSPKAELHVSVSWRDELEALGIDPEIVRRRLVDLIVRSRLEQHDGGVQPGGGPDSDNILDREFRQVPTLPE